MSSSTERPLPTFPCLLQARYSWSGEQSRDLGFVEGDIIEALNPGDGDWWFGKLQRTKEMGVFPSNFMRLLPSEKTKIATILPPSTQVSTTLKHTSIAAPPSVVSNKSHESYSTIRLQGGISRPASYLLNDDEIQSTLNYMYNYSDEFNEPQQAEIGSSPPVAAGPPLPPPHLESPTKRIHHDDDERFGRQLYGRNGRRTPSPLRGAMTDVLQRLNSMKVSGGDGHDDENLDRINAEFQYNQLARIDSDTPTLSSANSSTINDKHTPLTVMIQQEGDYLSGKLLSDGMDLPPPGRDGDRIHFSSSLQEIPPALPPKQLNEYSLRETKSLKSMSKTQSEYSSAVVSDFSATSAGSLARRKFAKEQQQTSNLTLTNTTATDIAITPVSNVPSATLSFNQLPSRGSNGAKAKLIKSTGFFKKFFLSDKDTNNSSQTGSATGSVSMSASSVSSSNGGRRRVAGGNSEASSTINGGKRVLKQMPTDPSEWMLVRRDINRSNSLSDGERRERWQRQTLQGLMVHDPTELFNNLDNECLDGISYFDRLVASQVKEESFKRIDITIRALNISQFPLWSFNQILDVSIFSKFQSSPKDIVRAAYIFCSEKLKWRRQESTTVASSIDKVVRSGQATVFEMNQCFKFICDYFRVVCEIIPGTLKVPGQVYDRRRMRNPEYHWAAVMIDNEWKMIDIATANVSNPVNKLFDFFDGDDIFFMVPPTIFLSMHIPQKPQDQHVVPNGENELALSLPLMGPGTLGDKSIRLRHYDSTMARLQDLEISQVDVCVSGEYECTAQVFTGGFIVTENSSIFDVIDSGPVKITSALCQPYWEKGIRYYRIKALLPSGGKRNGILNIYVGPRGKRTSIENNNNNRNNPLQLAFTMPIVQSGDNPIYTFPILHPTIYAQSQDLYILQPQCGRLYLNNVYSFDIKHHFSGAPNIQHDPNKPVKLAIQFPSGKMIKLSKRLSSIKGDNLKSIATIDNDPYYSLSEASIKCTEIGSYRGLILADQSAAWCVFAEWKCEK